MPITRIGSDRWIGSSTVNAGLWILIAVLVVVAVAAAFVVIRVRQRAGTVLAARGPTRRDESGGGA